MDSTCKIIIRVEDLSSELLRNLATVAGDTSAIDTCDLKTRYNLGEKEALKIFYSDDQYTELRSEDEIVKSLKSITNKKEKATKGGWCYKREWVRPSVENRGGGKYYCSGYYKYNWYFSKTCPFGLKSRPDHSYHSEKPNCTLVRKSSKIMGIKVENAKKGHPQKRPVKTKPGKAYKIKPH